MIDPATLTPEQQAGIACVVDANHPVYPGAVRVGFLGPDEHFVYACPGDCARQLDALVLERDPVSVDRSATSGACGRSTVLSGDLPSHDPRGPVGDPPADRSAVPVSRWTL